MATKREVSVDEGTGCFGMKLQMSKEDIQRAVDDGAKLELEESEFSDPGDDYSALLLDGKRVGYCAGY
jgi:hypothetical protein